MSRPLCMLYHGFFRRLSPAVQYPLLTCTVGYRSAGPLSHPSFDLLSFFYCCCRGPFISGTQNRPPRQVDGFHLLSRRPRSHSRMHSFLPPRRYKSPISTSFLQPPHTFDILTREFVFHARFAHFISFWRVQNNAVVRVLPLPLSFASPLFQ